MDKIIRYRFLFLFLIIPVISAFLHWKIFHTEVGGIHAWRQSQTMNNVLNFYRFDQNIINPRTNIIDKNQEPTIQRNEFPVLQWAMAMAYHLTGYSLTATRVFLFLLGLCSIGGMYFLITQIFDTVFIALAGAWAFSFSPIVYYFMMNPMPDNLALCGAIWSLGFFFKFLKSHSLWLAVASAVCMSLAIAAKLPYIVLLAAQGAWCLWSLFHKRGKGISNEIWFAILFLVIVAPALWWYVWVIPSWNNGVTSGIFQNQLPMEMVIHVLRYHGAIMFPEKLLGVLAVPFVVLSLFYVIKNKAWKENRFWWLLTMTMGIFLYWIFEFNMIGVVHDYYMMPFLIPLYVLAAHGIHQTMKLGKIVKGITLVLLISMPVTTCMITKNWWSVAYTPLHQDVYLNSKDLRKAAPAGAKCIILNDESTYFFSYLIDKQGFVFDHDYLPGGWVKDMINRYGTTYMYSNSRKVEEDPEVNPYFEKLVMERGNVKVFKLKSTAESSTH